MFFEWIWWYLYTSYSNRTLTYGTCFEILLSVGITAKKWAGSFKILKVRTILWSHRYLHHDSEWAKHLTTWTKQSVLSLKLFFVVKIVWRLMSSGNILTHFSTLKMVRAGFSEVLVTINRLHDITSHDNLKLHNKNAQRALHCSFVNVRLTN
jgi:hypothetical protein